MEDSAYQINNLISAYRKRNTLAPVGKQDENAPVIKQYRNKFVDGMMRERVPIHVQASKELSPLDNPPAFRNTANGYNINSGGVLPSNYLKNNVNFSGTKVKGEENKTQFRIRPQTPKLDMILLKQTKRHKLSKIQPLPIKAKDVNIPKAKITKKRIKLKRKSSKEEVTSSAPEVKQPEKEDVHTQQNFYTGKLVAEEEVRHTEDISDDDELATQPKSETGVLFGAAYENKYIDIVENEEVLDYTELNERMLEISLGMSKEELKEMTKVEIKVDTTNTHMQHVGEVLHSLKLLKLNDSVIPSCRDLGTSFRNLQVLCINR